MLLHPDDLEQARENRRRIWAGEIDNIDWERRFIHKDGKVLWARASWSLVRDADCNPSEVISVVQDITQRKAAEESLRSNEERFRGVFEQSAVGMALGGRDGGLHLVNQALGDFLGYTQDELIGKKFAEITHPDDLDRTVELRDQMFRGDISGHDWEKRYIRKNSEVVWGRVRLSLVHDADGNPGETVGVIQDITERKLAEEALRDSEERFRGIFEKTDVGIAIDRPGDVPVQMNEAFCRLLGYSVDENDEMTMGAISHPDDLGRSIENRRRLWSGEIESNEWEKRFIHKDGRIVWCRTSWTVVRDANGSPSEVVGLFQDITDHKLAEESLRQAQKMEAVGQLTGGVAHDFNNLLAAILGNLELIGRRGGGDPEIRQRVERAIQSAKAGGMLTNRLLAFSRRQTLEPKATDVRGLVDGMIDLLQHTIGEGITILTEYGDDLHLMLVDRNQLENAILNLAINARDAMHSSGELAIRCENVVIDASRVGIGEELTPGKYLSISISDTGQGVSPEILEHVFEPFFTTKDVGQGSRLGLSMVYGFAKQSGGNAEMESELGQGTLVRLLLPEADAEAVEELDEQDSRSIPLGQGERIFIIEDDDDVRDATSSMLSTLGYQVIDGGDGTQALQGLSRAGEVDLLLTDIVLPSGLRGTEIAAQARDHRGSLTILYMAGYAEEATTAHQDWSKIESIVLQKPFNMRDLGFKVRGAARPSAAGLSRGRWTATTVSPAVPTNR